MYQGVGRLTPFLAPHNFLEARPSHRMTPLILVTLSSISPSGIRTTDWVATNIELTSKQRQIEQDFLDAFDELDLLPEDDLDALVEEAEDFQLRNSVMGIGKDVDID